MRKWIIDTDPGTDDAIAIIAASKHQGVEILGITTVAGNKGLHMTTVNAQRLVAYNNLSCQVYPGAEISLLAMPPIDGSSAHGDNGIGDVDLPYDQCSLSTKNAVDFILEMVEKYPNEVEILAIGPLTNIALAIKKNKSLMKQVKSIVSMGGGVATGNMNPVSEFNYWFDAKAAQIVYDLGFDIPVHMVGLNVTSKAYFDANDLWFMKLEGGQLGQMIFTMQKDLIETSGWQEERIIGNIIHDLVAAVYLLYPDIMTVLHTKVDVVTEGFTVGQTVVETRLVTENLNKNAFVAMDINVPLFKSIVMKLLFKEDVGLLYQTYKK